MFKGKVVAFALMLLVATSVYAGDVDPCMSNAGITCTAMKLNVCPFGDFQLIRESCTGVGTQVIWAQAMDVDSNAIAAIPWTDYWVNSCDVALSLFLCGSPIAADSLTGLDGKTTFQGRLAVGGCNIPAGLLTSQGIYIAIQSKAIKAKPLCTANLCLPVTIYSPDLIADGVVNSSDLTVFGTSFNCIYPGPYPPHKAFNACCDYTHDGTTVNVSDFGLFGTHWHHQCQ